MASFGSAVNLGTVLGSLNRQILVILLALEEIVGSLLLDGELLIISSIAIPDDQTALMFSFLAQIEHAITFNISEGVVGLFVLSIFILLSLKEAEHNDLAKIF